jgi:hypothetical protein
MLGPISRHRQPTPFPQSPVVATPQAFDRVNVGMALTGAVLILLAPGLAYASVGVQVVVAF